MLPKKLGNTLSSCVLFSLAAFSGGVSAKPQYVSIDDNSVVQLAFYNLEDQADGKFVNDYLKRRDAIIKSNGGEVEAEFEVFTISEGKIVAHYISMIEWPDVATFDLAQAELQDDCVTELKNELIKDYRFGLYDPSSDFSRKLQANTVYEFYFFDFASEAGIEAMGQHFSLIEPNTAYYGFEHMLVLNSIYHPASDYYGRQVSGIGFWPEISTYFRNYQTSAFQYGIQNYREGSLSDIEVFVTVPSNGFSEK